MTELTFAQTAVLGWTIFTGSTCAAFYGWTRWLRSEGYIR